MGEVVVHNKVLVGKLDDRPVAACNKCVVHNEVGKELDTAPHTVLEHMALGNPLFGMQNHKEQVQCRRVQTLQVPIR